MEILSFSACLVRVHLLRAGEQTVDAHLRPSAAVATFARGREEVTDAARASSNVRTSMRGVRTRLSVVVPISACTGVEIGNASAPAFLHPPRAQARPVSARGRTIDAGQAPTDGVAVEMHSAPTGKESTVARTCSIDEEYSTMKENSFSLSLRNLPSPYTSSIPIV